MRRELSCIDIYMKDHKKVKVKTTGIPRMFLKLQGKRDAKKQIFQPRDMEKGCYFEKEKVGIYHQIAEKEKLYMEKALFEIRKEGTILIGEYRRNENDMFAFGAELYQLEDCEDGIALRRKGQLMHRRNELEDRNLKILTRIYEIDEMVNGLENCSKVWLGQHAERINEKRMVYYMGVRKVLPEIELPKELFGNEEYAVHVSDLFRRQFLEKENVCREECLC